MKHATLLAVLAALMSAIVVGSALADEAPVPDVRLVIDISGSMKRTDPDNLRIPAVKAVTGLLNNGQHAGIWTFGAYTNMLVKHGPVDGLWKELARIQTDTISSVALRTNIEEALDSASWDRNRATPDRDRHIILLTDGEIDVDDAPQLNAESRARVTGKLLPELKDAGIRVHTIALSDEADAAFLRQLALATDGTHGTVTEPEGLSRFFLRVLDRAAPAVEVPIDSGGFDIDASVEELTVLRFRSDDAPVALVTPAGERIEERTASERVRWYADPTYDLVTIDRPAPGRWRFDTPVGPDDRVSIVSNLALDVANPPATVFPGYTGVIDVTLKQDGDTITDPDFLSLLAFEAQLATPGGRENLLVEPADRIPEDGRFHVRLGRLEDPGEYDLVVKVLGKTFERIARRPTVMRDPVQIRVTPGDEPGTGGVVGLTIAAGTIDYDTVRVTGKVRIDDGPSRLQPSTQLPSGDWQIPILVPHGKAAVSVDIQGAYLDGQAFTIRPPPTVVSLPVRQAVSRGVDLTGHTVRAQAPEPSGSAAGPTVEPDVAEAQAPTVAPVPDTNPPDAVPPPATEPAPAQRLASEPAATPDDLAVVKGPGHAAAATRLDDWMWLAGAGVLAFNVVALGGWLLMGRLRRRPAPVGEHPALDSALADVTALFADDADGQPDRSAA